MLSRGLCVTKTFRSKVTQNRVNELMWEWFQKALEYQVQCFKRSTLLRQDHRSQGRWIKGI